MLVAAVRATARGTIGLVTSAGRLVKLNVLELPALPPGAAAVSLAGGTPVTEFASFSPGETVVGLAAVDTPGSGVALGTAEGVVKRVLPDYPQNRDEFELIMLKDGDRVVGAVQLSAETDELIFISSDAQLLHFTASTVRPQGRAAGGMAGIRLAAGVSVVWFGAADAAAAAGEPRGAARVLLARGRGHRGGPLGRAARRGGRQRQGHPAARVPGQGPGHRRRPLPAVPQGRGRAGHGLGRACPGGRRERLRRPRGAAGSGGQAGRLREALGRQLAVIGGSARVG